MAHTAFLWTLLWTLCGTEQNRDGCYGGKEKRQGDQDLPGCGKPMEIKEAQDSHRLRIDKSGPVYLCFGSGEASAHIWATLQTWATARGVTSLTTRWCGTNLGII